MGMIDHYWDDVTVYYIEFTALGINNVVRTHRKTLAFNSDVNQEEVVGLVKNYFTNIIEVKHVDELAEGLFLKKQFYKKEMQAM